MRRDNKSLRILKEIIVDNFVKFLCLINNDI